MFSPIRRAVRRAIAICVYSGLAAVLMLKAGGALAAQEPKPLQIGIIGLDTSHVVAFTKLINQGGDGTLENARVVAAYPGGSPDLPISADRLEGFTNTLREKYNVEIVDTIDQLLERVDAVLLESVNGRVHLEQSKPVFAAGKPVFIDKPIAASLADTIEIFELAKKHKVPCFTSSSLRFDQRLQSLSSDPEIGRIRQCDAFGPISPLKGHPELFFYGIHGIEMLFTVMGPGCEQVTWKDGVVRGVWKDGRIGTFRRGKYGVKVVGAKGEAESGGGRYAPLVKEICRFFRTGNPPVSAEETINLVAFMAAAQESKNQGGASVSIDSVMQRARQTISQRNK